MGSQVKQPCILSEFLPIHFSGLNAARIYIVDIQSNLNNVSVSLEEVYKAFFSLIDLYFDGDLFTIIREMLNELQVRYNININRKNIASCD